MRSKNDKESIQTQRKTELINMRFTLRGKMALDFLSRMERKSMTQTAEALVIERAIDAGFADYYDPNEGVMLLRIFLNLRAHVNDREVLIEEFVSSHRPFFYEEAKKGLVPNHQFVSVLWPQIENLAEHWKKRREIDAYATGERMQQFLRDAKIKPPAWGPGHGK